MKTLHDRLTDAVEIINESDAVPFMVCLATFGGPDAGDTMPNEFLGISAVKSLRHPNSKYQPTRMNMSAKKIADEYIGIFGNRERGRPNFNDGRESYVIRIRLTPDEKKLWDILSDEEKRKWITNAQ